MKDSNDIRVDCGWPSHHKTKRLERRLPTGPRCLIQLWCYAAIHRTDGNLVGMDDDDVEEAAGWKGKRGSFVAACLDPGPGGSLSGKPRFGFFERRDDGVIVLHDWDEHQPWLVSRPARQASARHATDIRWGKKQKQQVGSEVTETIDGDNADRIPGRIRSGMRNGSDSDTNRNPPSPSPSPVPFPSPFEKEKPQESTPPVAPLPGGQVSPNFEGTVSRQPPQEAQKPPEAPQAPEEPAPDLLSPEAPKRKGRPKKGEVPPSRMPAVLEGFAYWRVTCNHPGTSDPKPDGLIARRIDEYLRSDGMEAFKAVCRGAAKDPWEGRRHNDTPDILLREGNALKFRKLGEETEGQDAHPQGPRQPTNGEARTLALREWTNLQSTARTQDISRITMAVDCLCDRTRDALRVLNDNPAYALHEIGGSTTQAQANSYRTAFVDAWVASPVPYEGD